MLFISYNFLNNVTFIIIYQNIKVIVISLYMCRLTKKKSDIHFPRWHAEYGRYIPYTILIGYIE